MTQSELFRSNQEDKALMESQKTVPDRLGESYWQLTLRKPSNVPDAKYKCYQKINPGSELLCVKAERNELMSEFQTIRTPDMFQYFQMRTVD